MSTQQEHGNYSDYRHLIECQYLKSFDTNIGLHYGFIETEDSWNIVLCNRGSCFFTGYDREELVGHSIFTVFSQETRESLQEHFETMCRTHLKEFRATVVKKDGTHSTVMLSGIKKRQTADESSGYCFFIDTGEGDKDREGPLQEVILHVKSLLTAVEQSPVGIILTDGDGNIEYVNPFFSKVTGYAEEEVIGRNPRLLHSGRHSPDFFRSMWDTLLEGRTWRGEICNRKKNGEIYWEQTSISPIKNEVGITSHYIGVKEDVTEQRRVAREIRENRDLLQQLVDNISEVLWIVDLETEEVVFVSSAYMNIWGRTTQSLYDDPNSFMQAVHPEDVKRVRENHERLIRNRELSDIEYRIIRPDGEMRWIWSRNVAIIGTEEGAGRVVGISQDITSRKAAEAMREDAERITRHDLKSQLVGIINIPELLMEELTLTEEQAEQLRLIRENGFRMLETINKSLNVYKMETGTYDVQPNTVDLTGLLSGIVKNIAQHIDAKNLSFSVFIQRVPLEESSSFVIQTDEVLFYSMIVNLINNAVEASPQGGGISVSINDAGRKWKICIKNTGVVPAEIRDIFFEKYVSKGKADGTGLGTYSARLIVETLGGTIDMDSSNGKTRITILLPKEL